ncbi:MAG: SDR family oxidoreductase [Bacteroidota bacterium]
MNKVVLITGASSGIGKTTAEYLAKKGFCVYGTSRNPKHKTLNGVKMLKLDVSDASSVKAAIDTVFSEQNQLDVLVNNAGVGITGPLEETPEAEAKKAFDINFFGAIRMINAVLPQMRKQQSGLIINITSIAGYMGLPYRGFYSASKAALETVTETYRMELKEFNIQMTNIAPGDFATNIAAGRYHSPVLSGSAYAKNYQKSLETMDEHVDDGMPPIFMAKKIDQIINANQPKIHYKVGSLLQKFSIVLKRILPDKTYEKILQRHYGL